MKNYRLDTILQYWGDPKEHRNNLSPPIYPNVATLQPDCQTAAKRFSGEERAILYGRWGNENSEMLEKILAKIDGGEDALAFASGMAAIFCLMLKLLPEAGDRLVSQNEIYGGTKMLFGKKLPMLGRKTIFINNLHDLTEWERALNQKPKAVFVETPGNPTGDMCDLKKIADLARKKNIPLIADNTLVTSLLLRPLEWGATHVVRSLTKYENLGGTNCGGIIVSSKKEIHELRNGDFQIYGAPLSAFDAWLSLQSLKFLNDRVKKQSVTALHIAKWLEKNPAVKKVHYPLLQSSPSYSLAKNYFPEGAGAVVSIEISGNQKNVQKLTESLKLFSLAVNLGDTRSLVIPPAITTHSRLTAEERRKAKISDTLIRFSFGLEDIEDLKEDLDEALRKIKN